VDPSGSAHLGKAKAIHGGKIAMIAMKAVETRGH
jgi:hypothetical protein